MTERREYFLMLVPAGAVLAAVVLAPLGLLVYFSLLNWELRNPGSSFIGLANYFHMIRDSDFRHALGVTAAFIGGAIGVQVLLALFLTETLVALRRGQTLLRTLLLLPMVIPPLVVGVIWRILYDPTAGLLNYFLGFLGLSHAWLADPTTALGAVIMTDVWEWTPFVMLILLASYATIPEAIYEAAAVDGATRWTRFLFITFPLVRPMLVAAVVLRMIDVIREFAKIFITTGGGPGTTTETLNMYTYRIGFLYGNVGYAAALGVFMFLTVLALTLCLVRLQRAFEATI